MIIIINIFDLDYKYYPLNVFCNEFDYMSITN